jgi:hypothetical protein
MDFESTLEPRTAPPHLSFQLAHDPDYPPPTYVKGQGAPSRGRGFVEGVRRGWSTPEGSKLVQASEGCSRGAVAASYGSSSNPAMC